MKRTFGVTLLIVMSLLSRSLQDNVLQDKNTHFRMVVFDNRNSSFGQFLSEADTESGQNCFQCSDPCSHGGCCGVYSQCCYISGLGCRCCNDDHVVDPQKSATVEIA